MKKIWIVILSLALTACSLNETETITVAAAASLTNVFLELEPMFEEQYDINVEFVFGATGTLTEQIKEGAPYDLFFAANTSSVETLLSDGYLSKDHSGIFVSGMVGLVPAISIDTLLTDEITYIAIADPVLAPYGYAAVEVLEALGIYDDLSSKLVYGTNIANTYELYQSGNADAAIVAVSLITDEYTSIDSNLHTPINQGYGIIDESIHLASSIAFLTFLNTNEANEVIEGYGYVRH